ncbi:MAG: hypothetical protein ACT4PL_05230 [Phycisphaerales bacterium]
MPFSSPQLAMLFDGERLLAVVASGSATRLSVRSVVVAQRPDGVDPANPQSVGEWVGAELDHRALRASAGSGVILVLPKTDVVLRRLTLPPGLTAAEEPGAVRLAMMRHVPFAAETASVDYLRNGAANPDGGTEVLTASMSEARLSFYSTMARHAGMRVRRIAPGTAGAARLLGLTEGAGEPGAALLTLLSTRGGVGGCEFLVVRRGPGAGELLFSRGADVPALGGTASADQATFTEAVLVEAKRTYLAYRMSQGATEVGRVLVLGAGERDEFTAEIARRIGRHLELPGLAAALPGAVELAREVALADAVEAVHLLGALHESASDVPTLDLHNPRKPPDARARTQRLAVFAGLGVVCVGVVATMLARGSLDARRTERDRLKQEFAQRIAPEHAKYLRAKLRAEHIDRTLSARMDWVAHLRVLSEQMPAPKDALLDAVVADSDARVEFVWPKGVARTLSAGRWTPRLVGTLDVTGVTKQQQTANRFRERFEQDVRYQIATKGADVPNRFDYRISTTSAHPDVPETAKPKPAPKPGAAASPPENPAPAAQAAGGDS